MDDLERDLRNLLDADPSKASVFATMLRELEGDRKSTTTTVRPKVPKKHVPITTTYTEVERVHRCTHCGSEWHSTVKLTKMDTVPFLDENGKVGVITSKSPAVVYCYSGFCDFCRDFVENLSREELVERYLYLLSNFPFPQTMVKK